MAWKRGEWFAVCDVCGFKYLSGQLQKRWDGLTVCDVDFETRHPQEFVRSVQESHVPWTSPEPADINISVFDYVDATYWDQAAVVSSGSGATYVTDMYAQRDPVLDTNY